MKNQLQAVQAVSDKQAEIISPDELEMLRSAVTSEQRAGQAFEQARAAFIEARGAANFTKAHLSRKYKLSGEDGIELADGRVVRVNQSKGGAMPLSSQGNTPEERERREQLQREDEDARQGRTQEEGAE